MGLFKRIGTLLKSNINDLISKVEDPEKILNQLILDMRDNLMEARKHVAVAIADEKKLRKKLDRERDKARDWEKKAMLAVRAGRDDLAREALARKAEHDDLASEYQKQWELQKNATEKLRHSLQLLDRKINEAKRKKDLLLAKKARAEATEKIAQAVTNLSDTTAFSTFDRMAEKIEEQEARASAAAELATVGGTDSLEAQFEDLEAEHGADDALMALKARMGRVEQPTTAEETEDDEFNIDALDFDALEAAVAAGHQRAHED